MVTIVVTAVHPAQADQEGFTPYKMVSGDGKYVFVMYPSSFREHIDEARLYPLNGLYHNDGSTTPLWTVDWVAEVLLPSDGIHVVRIGRWPRQEEGSDAEALTFFANGIPLKRYSVRDLVDFPSLLPHTVSHYRWNFGFWSTGNRPNSPMLYPLGSERGYSVPTAVFDETTHTLTVETLHRDRITFDLNTGEIVSQVRPARRTLLALLTIFVLVYGLCLSRAARKPAKKSFKQSILLISGVSAIVAIAMLLVGLWLMSHSPHAWYENIAYNAVQLFIWSWPFRFMTRPDTALAFYYPYAEIQTFFAWFVTFSALAILNNRLVWILRRARAGQLRAQTAAP
jgi:hypothetical protein